MTMTVGSDVHENLNVENMAIFDAFFWIKQEYPLSSHSRWRLLKFGCGHLGHCA